MSRAWLRVIVVGIAALVCVGGVAHAQLQLPGLGKAGETAAPAPWSPPTKEVVDAQIADAKGRVAGLPADDPVAAELRKLIATLERQELVAAELNGSALEPTQPKTVIPDKGSVTIRQLDALRREATDAAARLRVATDRLDEAKRGIDTATTRLEDAERARRQSSNGDKSVQDVTVEAAKAALELARLERERAQREVSDAQQDLDVLVAAVERASKRARLLQSELAEIKSDIDAEEQQLQIQLATAKSELTRAEARLLDAQRRADAAADDASAQAELRALKEWEFAYRRESELLAGAIERLEDMRSLWDIRQEMSANEDFARSAKASDQIRDISVIIESASKLIDSRLADARQKDDRLRQAMSTDGTASRWQLLEQQGNAHRLSVLDAERRRLSQQATIVSHALADAGTAAAQQTLFDRLRSLGQSILGIWSYEVFSVQDSSITVGKLAAVIILLIAGLWIARWTSRLIGRFVLGRFGLEQGVAAAVQSIIFYVLLFTIALFALRLVNVPLTVFTVLGGALAIGIGFGSQNLMNNFISGLIMLAERPVRVGDFVQLDDVMGTVQQIGARSTRLLTPNNVDIIVPNSTFLESRVTNWTLTDDRLRTSVKVGVAYGSPTRDVIRLIKKAADDHGKVLQKPAPIVLFIEFGDNSLMFELVFWIRMRIAMDRRLVESDLRLRINELFKDAGLTIAFPQRDVHIDGLGPIDVRLLQAGAEGEEKSETEARG